MSLSQLIERRLGSYVASAPSSILTMSPSQPLATLSSRNVWISSSSWLFIDVAKANSPSTGTNEL